MYCYKFDLQLKLKNEGKKCLRRRVKVGENVLIRLIS